MNQTPRGVMTIRSYEFYTSPIANETDFCI